MTKNLWPGSEHALTRDDLFHIVNEHKEHHLESLRALVRMGDYLQILVEKENQEDAEIVAGYTVLVGQELGFYRQGYRYNRLIVGDNAVSDAAKLIIRYNGAKWTVTLAAGENKLNIPDGATIEGDTTSGNSFTGVWIYSNKE